MKSLVHWQTPDKPFYRKDAGRQLSRESWLCFRDCVSAVSG